MLCLLGLGGKPFGNFLKDYCVYFNELYNCFYNFVYIFNYGVDKFYATIEGKVTKLTLSVYLIF